MATRSLARQVSLDLYEAGQKGRRFDDPALLSMNMGDLPLPVISSNTTRRGISCFHVSGPTGGTPCPLSGSCNSISECSIVEAD